MRPLLSFLLPKVVNISYATWITLSLLLLTLLAVEESTNQKLVKCFYDKGLASTVVSDSITLAGKEVLALQIRTRIQRIND
jgi:hypothetical protein